MDEEVKRKEKEVEAVGGAPVFYLLERKVALPTPLGRAPVLGADTFTGKRMTGRWCTTWWRWRTGPPCLGGGGGL